MAAGGGAAGPAADASAAASLVSFLQSELLVLSNEIKRKHPPIKEVCNEWRGCVHGTIYASFPVVN
jgi:hypothetical protein